MYIHLELNTIVKKMRYILYQQIILTIIYINSQKANSQNCFYKKQKSKSLRISKKHRNLEKCL